MPTPDDHPDQPYDEASEEDVSEARLVLEHEGRTLELREDYGSAPFDELLVRLGAETWVFVPFVEPGDKPPKEKRVAKHRKRLAQELDNETALEGALVRSGHEPVPGVFVFDLARLRARELGSSFSLETFYWGARGCVVEAHPVAVLRDEDEDDSMAQSARSGIAEFTAALRAFVRPPIQWGWGPAAPRSLVKLTLALLVVGLSAHAWEASRDVPSAFDPASLTVGPDPDGDIDGGGALDQSSSSADSEVTAESSGRPVEEVSPNASDDDDDGGDDEDDDDDRRSLLDKLVGWILHPMIVPALICGIWLRRRLPELGQGGPARELTQAESEYAWRRFAPYLAGLWMFAGAAVLLVTSARFWNGSHDVVKFIEGSTRSLIICVWVLAPLGYARTFADGVGEAFSAALSIFIALIMMEIMLMVAGLGNRVIWSIITMLIPFEFPAIVRDIVGGALDAGAAIGFIVLMTGYCWHKQHERFKLWASNEYVSE